MATGELAPACESGRPRRAGAGHRVAGVPADYDVTRRWLLADAGRAEVEERRARLQRALADSTRRRSRRHTGSAPRRSRGWAEGDMEAGATVVRGHRTSSPRSPTTSTCAAPPPGHPHFSRSEALASPALGGEPGRADRAGAGGAADARERGGSPRRSARSPSGASGGSGPRLRRPAHPARRALSPGRPAPAAARLRERYRVVLVDEFQDTDPVQWDIVRAAFGGGERAGAHRRPQAAIYAFRGADVYAYLDAARPAGADATLDVNWRSDQRSSTPTTRSSRRALGHPDRVPT